MRVQPVSAEDANSGGSVELFKPGEYDFTIQNAEETTSSAGNDMLKLTLHVFNRNGERRTVFDYILSSHAAQWKARHMMEAIGMTRQYEAGNIDPIEITEQAGRLKLGVAPATAQYPAKNTVQDYVAAKSASSSVGAKQVRAARPSDSAGVAAPGWRDKALMNDGLTDDDIPF